MIPAHRSRVHTRGRNAAKGAAWGAAGRRLLGSGCSHEGPAPAEPFLLVQSVSARWPPPGRAAPNPLSALRLVLSLRLDIPARCRLRVNALRCLAQGVAGEDDGRVCSSSSRDRDGARGDPHHSHTAPARAFRSRTPFMNAGHPSSPAFSRQRIQKRWKGRLTARGGPTPATARCWSRCESRSWATRPTVPSLLSALLRSWPHLRARRSRRS